MKQTKRLHNHTPAADGFYMPAEIEHHKSTFMIWPERTDNWRDGAKLAQTPLVNTNQ